MPSKSDNENVYKRCDCTYRKQSTCEHPWFFGWKPKGKPRIRKPLAYYIGYHAPDRLTAEREALRVKVALANGEDPRADVKGDDVLVGDLLKGYQADHAPRTDSWQIPRLVRTIGTWPARNVTKTHITEYRATRPKVAGNRDVSLLRAAFNWAVLNDKIESTPFLKGGVPTIEQLAEEPRSRRLYPDEYEALLAACRDDSSGQDMRDLIVAAVETGARSAELAQIQWHEVGEHTIFLPAVKTKTKKDRRVPISPDILRPVLNRRRLDPAGNPLPLTAYVFGDACGRAIDSRDRAWAGVILRAHGHTPEYLPVTKNLAPGSRLLLKTINLHFHDLRREAASRWMDAGVPLATISRWLGHANISQTSTYLAASLGNDESDIARYVEYRQRQPSPVSQTVTQLVADTLDDPSDTESVH